MQKSTILALLAAAAVTASAANPSLQENAKLRLTNKQVASGKLLKGSDKLPSDLKTFSQYQESRKAPVKNSPVKKMMRAPGAPDTDMPIITEAPEGKSSTFVKSGIGWVYNMWFGLVYQSSNGSISDLVVTDDNKVYFNNIFSLVNVDAWLEGKVEDGKYSFSFPQHIEHSEEDWGTPDEPDIEISDWYAVVLEYIEDEEDAWFYPAEDQTYTFTVNPDGSFTADNPDLMIGACQWVDDPESGEEPFWGWIMLGEQYDTLSELTAVAATAPAEVEFEDWTFVNGPLAHTVEVGFFDGKCYLKGLTPDYPDLMETPVIGRVVDDKVIFPSGQYLGVVSDYLTTGYFMSGVVTTLEDEWGPYDEFNMAGELIFDYSADDNLLTTDGAFCLSAAPDEVLYFDIYNDISIKKPSSDAKVEALRKPLLDYYYEDDNNVIFFLPMTDANYNILDTDKYFWNLLLDDDVYVFAADEYEGLAEMFGPDFEMTDVPYGFHDGVDFWGGWNGNEDFYVYAEGYDTMAIRGVYKDGDNVIYSPLLYVVGEPSGVKDIENTEVVSSSYFDLQGRKLRSPLPGICIRADKMSDGSMNYVKVVRK